MERCTFRREDRLVRPDDFKALKTAGTRVSTPHFVVMARPSPTGRSRLGITAGTSIGKATQRNRVKRLLREFFRLHRHVLPAPTDMVIVAKKGSVDLSLADVVRELGERMPSLSR